MLSIMELKKGTAQQQNLTFMINKCSLVISMYIRGNSAKSVDSEKDSFQI